MQVGVVGKGESLTMTTKRSDDKLEENRHIFLLFQSVYGKLRDDYHYTVLASWDVR
jgi:hypothetical protein